MGHFYNPPPPFAGGAQPLAPRELPPGVPGQSVDAPPIGPPFKRLAPAIIDASEPHPSDPLPDGYYLPRWLNASLTAVPVNDPPYAHSGRDVWIVSAVQIWQPPEPWPFFNGRQQLELLKRSAGVPGASVDAPPTVEPRASPAVFAWQPPDPQPFTGGLQPLERRRPASGIPGQSVDRPPPGTPFDLAWPSIILSWRPPPPDAFMGASQELGARRLTPILIAVQVDSQPRPLPQILTVVFSAWQPPDPAPRQLAPVFTPDGAAVVVTYVPYAPAWLSAVLRTWIPADPSPQSGEKLTPASIDRPPGRNPALATILRSPDPILWPPQIGRTLSPGIPGQSVDVPPGLAARQAVWVELPIVPTVPRGIAPQIGFQVPASWPWLATVMRTWAPVEVAPQSARRSLPGVSVDRPPAARDRLPAAAWWDVATSYLQRLARAPLGAFAGKLNPNLIARGLARGFVATSLPRKFAATGAARSRIVTGISNAMALANDLIPPIDASVEVETVTFDFGMILASGVTITSITSVSCVAYSGTDASASSRLIGGASTGASPATGAASAAVLQLVGNMLAGVTYRLQCVVQTSDGQTLSLWTHLACQAPA